MSSFQRPILRPAANKPGPKTATSRLPRFMLITVVVASIAVLTFVIGARYFGDTAKKSGNSEDLSIRQIIVGNDVVNIPANVFRFSNQREATTSKQLDLFYHWPDFKGYSVIRHSLFYGADKTPESLIFVTIGVRQIRLDMSERFRPVYSNLLEGKLGKSAIGLVYQGLKPEAGYSGEELHFQPGIARPYAIRCQRSDKTQVTASCMRDINIGKGLSVTYRFSRKLLPNWRAIEETVRKISTGYLSN